MDKKDCLKKQQWFFLQLAESCKNKIDIIYIKTQATIIQTSFIPFFCIYSDLQIQCIQSINKTMTKTNIYSLKIYQDHEKKSFFLRDSKFDFLLALNNEFFPIHETILDKSCFLSNSMKDHQGSKIFFLFQDFNKKTFTKILACLYGNLLSFEGNQEVQEILEVANFLQISEIKIKICQHLLQKFEQYDLIFLYKLSKKFQIQELFQKCLEQLIFYKYEHLQINKFDLLMSDQSIVTEFLSEYLILKSKNIVPRGPSDQQIKNFALQYNALNQNSLDIYQIYLHSVFDQIAIQKLMLIMKKISKSDRLISTQIQVELLSKRKNIHRQQDLNDDQRINQIMELNSEIFKRSKSVCEEIKKISQQINNYQSQNQSCELQEISKKMREFEQDFNNQETRLRKLSLDLRRSSNFKNFSSSSKTCKSQ